MKILLPSATCRCGAIAFRPTPPTKKASPLLHPSPTHFTSARTHVNSTFQLPFQREVAAELLLIKQQKHCYNGSLEYRILYSVSTTFKNDNVMIFSHRTCYLHDVLFSQKLIFIYCRVYVQPSLCSLLSVYRYVPFSLSIYEVHGHGKGKLVSLFESTNDPQAIIHPCVDRAIQKTTGINIHVQGFINNWQGHNWNYCCHRSPGEEYVGLAYPQHRWQDEEDEVVGEGGVSSSKMKNSNVYKRCKQQEWKEIEQAMY